MLNGPARAPAGRSPQTSVRCENGRDFVEGRNMHRHKLSVWFVLAAGLAASASAQQAQPGLTAFENVAVPMADRIEVSRLVDAGSVSLDGARGVVVTVAGELRGRASHDGKVGVLAIPDIPFFTNLYRSQGVLLSAAEFAANVASGDSGYFISKSRYTEVGFSRYRLLLFNTTGAPVSANVYVYQSRN